MKAEAYLESLLGILSGSFDLYRPYTVGGKEYPAYGYYFSLSEKFLVTEKVNLWSARMYEHILFIEAGECTMDTVREAKSLIEGHMEETLVRRGEKYPEKDHMVSYITVCIVSESTPDEDVRKAIEAYRYGKNYLFTIRGRAEGRLICADLGKEKIISNRSGRQVLKIYDRAFRAR